MSANTMKNPKCIGCWASVPVRENAKSMIGKRSARRQRNSANKRPTKGAL